VTKDAQGCRRAILKRDEKEHLKLRALHGVEIVPGVARLCAMNLLHGIGPTHEEAGLDDPDAIAAEIVEDLRAALEEFEAIAGELAPGAEAELAPA
jgi:type I restriction-modification system DNA methylase subunit